LTTAEFLSAELARTQTELHAPILNRARWDALCEDRRMLAFLMHRADAADFQSIEAELNEIAAGRVRPPQVEQPRRQAEACLRDWTQQLAAIA
jgi:hypothetical protein